MRFCDYRSDVRALEEVADYGSVSRLLWFNHRFMKAEEREGRLVLSDLRMGAEPDYTFRFVVAERAGTGWREVPPEQLSWPWDAAARLSQMWTRIWTMPAATPAGVPRPCGATAG
jgi:inner membrane protein